MAIQTKEKTIGEHNYAVTQLPARRALRMKAKLIKLFGPGLAQFLMTSQESEEKLPAEMTKEEKEQFDATSTVDHYRIKDMRKSAIVRGVQLLVSSLDDKTFDELCVELLQGVRRDGVELTPQLIDMSFAGDLTSLYAVIFFVLEVNYADFFAFSGIGNQLMGSSPQEQDTKKNYTFK